eukprot:scaffold56547_cov72-Phaeocystis_antarctica.AAC.1
MVRKGINWEVPICSISATRECAQEAHDPVAIDVDARPHQQWPCRALRPIASEQAMDLREARCRHGGSKVVVHVVLVAELKRPRCRAVLRCGVSEEGINLRDSSGPVFRVSRPDEVEVEHQPHARRASKGVDGVPALPRETVVVVRWALCHAAGEADVSEVLARLRTTQS